MRTQDAGMTDRSAVLVLAGARTTWGRDLARQATAGALPIDVVLCLSADETAARLDSERRWSMLLIDAEHPALDRDLVDRAHRSSCGVTVVGDRAVDLSMIGADRQLSRNFGREELLGDLDAFTAPVERPATLVTGSRHPGLVVGVVGSGGTGASTIAMALAQGLGDRYGNRSVVLADLRRNSEHAALHGTADVLPGLPELIEGHRLGDPNADELSSLVYEVTARHYDLLLGLRRARDWAAIRPRAIDAAYLGLRRSYQVVVADADPEVEGHAQCGSLDVEERNHLSRATFSTASAVVVVGTGSLKGVLSFVRLITDLVEFGVSPTHIVPLVNTISRRPFQRPALASTIRQLCRPVVGRETDLRPVAFVPFSGALEGALRDAARLPRAVVDPAVTAVHPLLVDRPHEIAEPESVRPGALGHWRSAGAAS